MKNKHSGFSGSLGFVLAAAGSAVGVGNIWRFPYLCAKDGGGLFLLVYLVLVLTFGFTLLTTDVAIGRRTKQNALNAFGTLHKKWRFLGYLTFLVPTLIMTYYSVIGGWIAKYFAVYLVSDGTQAAQDGFFTSFITSQVSPIVFMLLFLALTAWVVYCGVEKGIEKYSRYIMPVLLLLVIGIAVFSLTLSHTDDSGVTRTGLQGLAFYLKPDFTGMTLRSFLNVVLDAMSQLFFSLSVSMGIMITYGSYVKDDVDLNKANSQIEIFDTGVAFLAGVMIIPSVYVFLGVDGVAKRTQPDLHQPAPGVRLHGRRGPDRRHRVLPGPWLRGADQLCIRHGNAGGKLHGDLPQEPQGNVRHGGRLFSGDHRDHLPWLQRVLLRADPAQRQRRSASGRDGLHQQPLCGARGHADPVPDLHRLLEPPVPALI